MSKLVRRVIGAAASLLLALIGIVAIEPEPPASALNGSMFDPGLIISDSVFYDFGTMTVAEIQRFLDAKNPNCRAAASGPACLKNYRMDTQAKAGESGRCDPLSAKTDQSAAQIIFDVANACKINPRVLLVILQKEQGLVQAPNPTEYMYRAALGYGCPDSKPEICGKGSTITGLFNQLYRGAGQLQWYGDPRGSFTYLKVGTNISVKYYPDDNRSVKCGSKTFMLKSQATAALYYYTPYTPNEAALKNLYGTGDNCSAYGNRNFWRFFSDWFGSPIAGGFLLKSADSDTYLIVDEKKYKITDPSILPSLEPLGPLGTVSQPYLDSFQDGGEFTPIVKAANQQKYLIAGGKRYSISSCALAADFGLDCAKAITLTSSQLQALPLDGPLTRLVKGAAEDWYYVDEGQVREILDDASVEAEGISLPVPSNVSVSQLSGLIWGKPIAASGSLVTNRSTGAFGVYVSDEFYELDSETAKAIDFTKWFTASGGTLSTLGLSAVDKATVIRPFIKDSLENFWVLTPDGRQRVTAASPFVPEVATVSTKLLSFIATLEGSIGTPALAKVADQKSTYYVTPGVARITPSAADRAGLSEYLAQEQTITLTAPAFAQLTLSTPVLAPASLVKSKTSGQVYLVNGWTRALKMPDQNALDALSLGVPRAVNETSLAGYQTNASFSGLKYVCDGVTYLPVNGLALRIEAADAVHFPGRATKLSPAVCEKFVVSDQVAGRFVFDETARKYFLIDSGKRRPIATAAAYRKLATGLTKSFVADKNLLARVPIGAAAPTSLTSGGSTSGGSGDSGGSTGGGSTGGGSTTPTTYTVVAGDTLSKIATKFKTTVDLLLKANNLTSANLIKVGQKLTIVLP
jgi:hypothetical protein